METKMITTRLFFSGLALSFLLVGCATREPYQGPISSYLMDSNVARQNKPLPIQLFVRATGPEDPGTRDDLLTVFMLNLKLAGKFASVVPVGSPVIPSLARLDMDIDLKMEISNRTPPWYVISWGCIIPMFIPGNKITADGRMTAVIRDNQSVLKTYSAEKTSIAYRNSVGIALIKIETRTVERWSRATITALFDDLILQIANDTETYQKAGRVSVP